MSPWYATVRSMNGDYKAVAQEAMGTTADLENGHRE